jgi:predicted nucleic-acid-binding protein
MNKQYHIRQLRVKEILETILKIEKEEMKIDKKRFIFEISERYGCTERKAKEYLKVAELKLEYGHNAEQELRKGQTERVQNN